MPNLAVLYYLKIQLREHRVNDEIKYSLSHSTSSPCSLFREAGSLVNYCISLPLKRRTFVQKTDVGAGNLYGGDVHVQ